MITEKLLAFSIETGAFQMLSSNQSLSGTILGYFVVMLVIFLSFILPMLFIVPMILNWRKNRYILRHGEPAQATILKIWDTGITINKNPQVGMLLVVYAENQAPFQVETKSVVSRLQIPQIQIGSEVKVRYDRENPLNVALVL